jgi:hypothetical protein
MSAPPTVPTRGRYRKAARQAVSMSIGPYGYTLTIWTSGAMLTRVLGLPGILDALLFVIGAVGALALIGVASFGSLTARVRVEPRPPALWASLDVVSVGGGMAAATAIAHLLANAGAWPLGGFAATTSYLGLLAAQLALAG